MASIINAATSGGLVTSADTSGVLQLQTASTTAVTVDASQNVSLAVGTANGVTYLNGSKVLTSGSALTYNGTDLQFASGSGLFTNTSDGSDTATLAIGGGGANSTARGSVIELYGNENATAGVLDMTSGNVANSYVRIQGRSSTSYVRFDINASEQMRLTSTGLGIGTSSPRGKLDVNGTALIAGGGQLQITGSPGSTGLQLIGQDAAESLIGTMSAQALAFRTNSSERARIDSSGNLLVGTTSAVNTATRAGFYNAGSASPVVGVQNARNVSGDVVNSWLIGSNANNTSSYFLQCGVSGVANVMYIYGNGNIQNTNNSYGGISDVKLKENIVDASPKLADLLQVKVRNYNFIGSTTKQIGVVAQELETIFPAMVDESPDRDADNNVLETTTKSVKYSVFVPMLIKAIQEQQALITQLQADVATLKGN